MLGIVQKLQPLVSQKLRDAAHGKPCIRCNTEDGTVCGRHYNGIRQAALGKGRGVKCDDFAEADLCNDCDSLFQEGAHVKRQGNRDDYQKKIEHSEEFLFLCILTLIRRRKEGVIKV